MASDVDVKKMEEDFRSGGVGYGDFKKRLFAALWEFFAEPRARRAELAADLGYVDSILAEGAIRAGTIAEQVIRRVRTAVGLRG